jgi:hypothetical protein
VFRWPSPVPRLAAAAAVAVAVAAPLSACASPSIAVRPAAAGAPAGQGRPEGQGGSGGSSLVLGTPAAVGDYTLHQPTAANLQKMKDALTQATGQFGISGTPATAVYDDEADDAWIVFVGVTGSGFVPDKVTALSRQVPTTRTDGTGDVITSSWPAEDPGPHGGQAVCNEQLLQSGGLAVEGGDCLWMTATTFGAVSMYPKNDGKSWDFGWSAAKQAQIMRSIRSGVETLGAGTAG